MDPIAQYTFLPWYRTGLASAIDANAQGGERGRIAVRLKTRVDAADGLSDPKDVHLVGPGDIIGVDPRGIVRVDPRPNIADFEPNYLAAIEFFDEDFPWRYSPRAPEGEGKARLLPWLALLVLADGEFERVDQGEGLPPAVAVAGSLLPPPGDLWAWAHTHINRESPEPVDPRQTAALLRGDPALGLSRIVAARRLKSNHSYTAMLVPAFEAGRRAGVLPADAPPREMAWDAAGNALLPIYYQWSFRTGEAGDFEQLAERLNPVLPDLEIGRRPMNMARPLPGLATPPIVADTEKPRPVLELEGALQLPLAKPSKWAAESREAFQNWLAGFVNLAEVWTVDPAGKLDGAPALPAGTKLPIVLPPSYGRWHANVATLEPANPKDRWLETLNLDPRNRVAAAFGTLVVQKNQEDFMARAWAQYGELFAANRYRYRAQLMRDVLTASVAKHLAPLAEPMLLVTTGLTHARILLSDAVTVHGTIAASALPVAAVQPTLRRVLRARGPLSKRFGRSTTLLEGIVRDVASALLSVALPWRAPEERVSLAAPQPRTPGDAQPATWLGGTWDQLRPIIVEYLKQTRMLADFIIPDLRRFIPLLENLLARGDEQASMSAPGLTPAAVAQVRERAEWIPPSLLRERANDLQPADSAPSPVNPGLSFAADNFRQAMHNTTALLTEEAPARLVKPPLDLPATAAALRAALSPYASVSERVARVVGLPPAIKIATYDPLETIMAYPAFDDATYEHLKKISQDYVIPNLSKIPNNGVMLLEVNWRFVESFLVGLNHEMARELLWRGYRTDQRGTCFPRFWDLRGVPGAAAGDIQPIHGWRRDGVLTPLGGNRPQGAIVKDNIVLVVRGDLLRRYPNTMVYAQKAVPNAAPAFRVDPFKNIGRRPGLLTKEPVLFAFFEPDIFCFGFDINRAQARGKPPPEAEDLGWYFVLAERFGEPRFGLDEPKLAVPDFDQAAKEAAKEEANDLDWATLVSNANDYAGLSAIDLSRHAPKPPAGGFVTDKAPALQRAAWNRDSAQMAAILLQSPFRMYFHANDMLLP